MNENQIVQLVATLREKGIAFEKGLSDAQILHIEALASFQFPPDLKAFLQYAVPISYTRRSWDGDTQVDYGFPNWHQAPQDIVRYHKERILDVFRFDIEQNGFWLREWGKQPESLEKAVEIVSLELEKVPQLIPLYVHRYLPAFPVMVGNPVLSMFQPIDTIYYGYNLENYFHNEFLSDGKFIYGSPSDYRSIPFWYKIVG